MIVVGVSVVERPLYFSKERTDNALDTDTDTDTDADADTDAAHVTSVGNPARHIVEVDESGERV